MENHNNQDNNANNALFLSIVAKNICGAKIRMPVEPDERIKAHYDPPSFPVAPDKNDGDIFAAREVFCVLSGLPQGGGDIRAFHALDFKVNAGKTHNVGLSAEVHSGAGASAETKLVEDG